MTNKEISTFITKYGGRNIDFYVNKTPSRSYAATTFCYGVDEKTKHKLYVIVLQKEVFRNKKNAIEFLHALLLHEIGHIKQKHFDEIPDKATGEFEAQMWAISLALKLEKYAVLVYLVDLFFYWNYELKKNKKRLRYYYEAYEKFSKLIGKRDMKLWEKILKEGMVDEK